MLRVRRLATTLYLERPPDLTHACAISSLPPASHPARIAREPAFHGHCRTRPAVRRRVHSDAVQRSAEQILPRPPRRMHYPLSRERPSPTHWLASAWRTPCRTCRSVPGGL